jgi:hypothetical protein
MSKKDAQVPGLPLINPTSLQPEFRRFRNDALYFIHQVIFTSTDEEKSTSKPRILAVTPQALFVCDALGSMDRAVRLEQLDGIVSETRLVRKVFVKDEQVHFIIRVPSEFDILCVLEGNKEMTNVQLFKNLVRVLETAVRYRKEQTGVAKGQQQGFTTEEVPAGKKITDMMRSERPQEYLSPKDIIAQNQARQRAIDAVDSVNRQILELQEKIAARTKSRDEKQRELRALEGALGSDVKLHHEKRDKLAEQQRALHKQQTTSDVELMRLQTAIGKEQERLDLERQNADELIKQTLATASGEKDKELDDAQELRKRAQLREIAKAMKHLDGLRAKVSNPPNYVGPPHLVQRAQEAEKKVLAAAAKWEKEMETANKLEGYFDTAISDLNVINEQIQVLVERKREALDERDRKQASAPGANPASPAGKVGGPPAFDDDDLLGGGGPAAPAPTAPAAGGFDDDDLLGGGGPKAPAAAASRPAGGPAADDDDLLGGGGGGPAPSAVTPAAAEPDDLL